MNPLKSPLILILLASLAGNLYLTNVVREKGEKLVLRNVMMDEPVVMRTKGGLLEVSAISSQERFESSKDHSFFGVFLGTTATRIRVPAMFRYHIELAPEWKILLRDKTFIVVAPPVKPTLPVAIDTALLEKQSFGVWSKLTGTTLLDQLQRSITQSLASEAASPKYVQLQRETARKTVTEFVAKWLITQEQWKSASSYPIRVFFSDEPIQVLGNVPMPVVASR